MEYITEVLGIKVTRKECKNKNNIPYFLLDNYVFEIVLLNDIERLFIKPTQNLAVINTVKKHLVAIKKACDFPVVFELSKMTRRKM